MTLSSEEHVPSSANRDRDTSMALPSVGYHTRSPFVIDQDTYVVAAVGGTVEACSPHEGGWFASDFYAFNYLFKGLGRKQAWIAGADPRTLVRKHGDYLHGNPDVERKVVLSNELLDSGKLSPVDVVSPSSVGDRFVETVREFDELAGKEGAKLLLLIFCHGTAAGELELGGQSGTSCKLTLAQLKGCIDMRTRTTLVTTGCFSGKWLVNPLFNYTAMTAATDVESISWDVSDGMTRACGSLFASALIESLSNCSADQQSAKERGEGEASEDQAWGKAPHPRPESATEAQTATYMEFCKRINEICGARIVEGEHEFMFAAQNDDWDMPWTDRTGISYLPFKQRWQALKTHVTVPVPVGDGDGDGSLVPHTDGATAPRSRTGGIARSLPPSYSDDRIVVGPHEPLDDLQKARLRSCITWFLGTNPGSWRYSDQHTLGAFLRDCHRRGSPYQHFSREVIGQGDADPPDYQFNAYSVMQFRTDFARVLDYIIAVMGLPRPGGQPALLHDHCRWMRENITKTTQDAEENRRLLLDWRAFFARPRFVDSHFLRRRKPSQGPPFFVMAEYMTAVMYEYHKSTGCCEANTAKKVDEFYSRFGSMERSLLDVARKDKAVAMHRKRWKDSLGKA